MGYQEIINKLDSSSIIYIDESGVDNNITVDKGYSPKGERFYYPQNAFRSERHTMIAALNKNLLLAPFVFTGFTNTAIFKTYIKEVLLPVLIPGKVIVMDNASFHKSQEIKDLIESAGCKLLFLPKYSPDLNPIENYWAILKLKTKTFLLNASISFEQAICSAFEYYCSRKKAWSV